MYEQFVTNKIVEIRIDNKLYLTTKHNSHEQYRLFYVLHAGLT